MRDMDEAALAGEIEYLKGSPRVALDIANPFTSYLFIERSAERLRELEALKTSYGVNRNISIHAGDANDALHALLAKRRHWRNVRGVVFLDPFGMHVPWATVEALARTKVIEVFVNFPLGMAIGRLLARSGDITPGRQFALDEYFGSPAWRQHAYRETQTLFGPGVEKLDDAGPRIVKWYRARLAEAFGYASTARLITNTRGGHLYYLIWAGPKPLGLKVANHVLRHGQRVL